NIVKLGDALKGEEIEREEARQAMRALIDHIVVTPAEDRRGVALEVRGRLSEMMDFGHKKPPQAILRRLVWYRWLRGQDLNL
ncbi:hypothetical protein, partial [Sphingomonas hylomeconis]